MRVFLHALMLLFLMVVVAGLLTWPIIFIYFSPLKENETSWYAGYRLCWCGGAWMFTFAFVFVPATEGIAFMWEENWEGLREELWFKRRRRKAMKRSRKEVKRMVVPSDEELL